MSPNHVALVFTGLFIVLMVGFPLLVGIAALRAERGKKSIEEIEAEADAALDRLTMDAIQTKAKRLASVRLRCRCQIPNPHPECPQHGLKDPDYGF